VRESGRKYKRQKGLGERETAAIKTASKEPAIRKRKEEEKERD